MAGRAMATSEHREKTKEEGVRKSAEGAAGHIRATVLNTARSHQEAWFLENIKIRRIGARKDAGKQSDRFFPSSGERSWYLQC